MSKGIVVLVIYSVPRRRNLIRVPILGWIPPHICNFSSGQSIAWGNYICLRL